MSARLIVAIVNLISVLFLITFFYFYLEINKKGK